MILINLLPHREAARKRRRELFYVALAASAVLGLVLGGIVYAWYEAQISGQRGKNQYLQSEIKVLELQIKDIATLQNEIASLRARQQAVEDLQADRNLPVHLLNELVRQLPSGVYLTSLKQDNQTVTVTGVAQSNERVSELLRNLAYNSQWLKRPELVEIVASNLALSPRDQRRVSNFTVRVRLLRASEVARPASAPVSVASAASAPVGSASISTSPAGVASAASAVARGAASASVKP